MPDNNEQNSTPVTIEVVTELVNKVVSGSAARIQKEFAASIQPINETLHGLNTTFEELRNRGTNPAPSTYTPDGKNAQPAVDPKIGVMEKQLRELQSAREADQVKAARLEKENALNKVLGGYQFANDVARETAFKTFQNDLQVTSDGQFVIGDEPLDAAIKGRMAHLSGLLAPKNVGGSGASPGQRGTQATLDSLIKPKMTKEEIAEAYKLLGKR